MRTSVVEQLACPRVRGGTTCGGALRLDERTVAPVYANEHGELLEALLGCSRCGTGYPVIAGVAILLNDEQSWLRANYYYVMEGAARAGGIGPALMQWLDGHCLLLANRLADNYYETPRWVSMFAVAHYAAPAPPSDGAPLLEGLMAGHPSVFDVAPRMIERHLANRVDLALDIGTNVGGMARRIGGMAGSVFGIDVAFNAVLTARRANLGLPTPIGPLREYVDGHRYVEHDVPRGPPGMEFLLASFDQLPIRGDFGLVTALNVIDVVPQPRSFLRKVSGMLQSGGLLLLTSPYSWTSDSVPVEEWLGGTAGLSSAEAVREAVEACGLDIVEEALDVPWVLREHRQWHRVFVNHCILARKRNDAT